MSGILIIATLVLMECVLSIDNAAALATMVRHLPESQRTKALHYGMAGAYLFRGIALAFASYLIHFSALKFVGGVYLAYIAYDYFRKGSGEDGATKTVVRSFWKTVFAVEAMDMVFSIDNVFAAVALSDRLLFVCIGVAIGILAMRFVAGAFVKMLEKHPELEDYAFFVIAMLGFKLCGSVLAQWLGFHGIESFLEGHVASAITSGITVCLFLSPFVLKHDRSA